MGDEFRNRSGRDRWMDRNDVGLAIQTQNWRDVADEVEIELIVERGIDCVCHIDQEKRVSVGGCTHNSLRANIVASTRAVVDDEWLAELLREPLTEQARKKID